MIAGRPANVERLKLSRRPIASTITVGIANCCPLTRTIIALWIAKLVGNFMVNAVPWPGVDSTSRVPLRRDTLSRTTSRPTPRPLSSLSTSAVEKPGRKIKSMTSLSLSTWSAWIKPRAIASLRTRSGSIPTPSSRTVITTWFPS